MNALQRSLFSIAGAALVAASLACSTEPAFAAARRRSVTPGGPRHVSGINATVQFAPQPVRGKGAQQLAWEVILRNDSDREITIETIEVLRGGSDRLFANYNGPALRPSIINLPPRPANSPRPQERIGAREGAVILFLVAQPSLDDIPPLLEHRFRFTDGTVVRGVMTSVNLAPPPVLSAPLRGGNWRAWNGLGSDSLHRRAGAMVDGRSTFAQRFAIDWARVDASGKTYSGDRRRNTSYYAYGMDVLAPADGVVTIVKDGLPDNIPQLPPVVPITLETLTGNYVVIDIGNNQFAVAAHLKPGSIAVRAGDRVTKGMRLAQLGNSGNSSEPHLHFHLCDASSNVGCEGLPYVLDHFSTPTGPRQLELPMKDEVVDFH
ncbi:MAG TPA: M23 family metallopeptidase [Thermoanaerobaculia bacterium]|nr:M23 family metallopeptidase [Thermoanaerobaculia bacterium]